MPGIGQVSPILNPFSGIGFISVGGNTTNVAYATLKLPAINFSRVGDLLGDGTSYTGTAAELVAWVNEQGETVSSVASGGDMGYTFTLMNFSAEVMTRFLGTTAQIVDVPADSWTPLDATLSVQSTASFQSFVAPFIIYNQTQTRWICLPKCRWVCQPIIDSKNHAVTVVVTAEKIDTTDLKTFMSSDSVPSFAPAV